MGVIFSGLICNLLRKGRIGLQSFKLLYDFLQFYLTLFRCYDNFCFLEADLVGVEK